MEIKGAIKLINNEEVISDKFKKRSFVIVTDEKYSQSILIELHQDRTDLIDPYTEGEGVIVHININGREWVNPEGVSKYFNTIVAWKLEKLSSNTDTPAPTNQVEDETDDDLPF